MKRMETRPRLKIELTSLDAFFEWLGWAALMTLWGLILTNYSNLPDTIPTHYNGAGMVDHYGSKSSILALPVIGTILFVGLTILNKFPHIFNYPTTISADNALRQYVLATRLIRFLKFVIILIFGLIVFMTLQTATGESEGLGVWFLPLTLGLVFIPVVYYAIQSYRFKK